MISPAQIDALEAAAKGWLGTPFCEGAPVRGAGVSCHHLCAEVYFGAGLIARRPIPDGPSRWVAAQPKSLIEEWVEQSGLFVRIEGDLVGAREPGDMLGFRLGHSIHHAAVALGGGRLVHSVVGLGVTIAPGLPFPWERRLERVWRLKSLLAPGSSLLASPS